MNALLAPFRRPVPQITPKTLLLGGLALTTLLFLSLAENPLRTLNSELLMLVVETLSDAYLAVSVFVALSLLVIYAAQSFFGADLIGFLNSHPRAQVPVAALLGGLPGCGGAIIVVTQFVHGKVGFGALVAVLISTMGDASFLLLASEPKTAALVFAVSMLSGVIFGYLIELIHGRDFLKSTATAVDTENSAQHRCQGGAGSKHQQWRLSGVWGAMLVPGIILCILAAFQVELDGLFGEWSVYQPATWFGFAGALLCVLIWFRQPPSYSWAAAYDSTNTSAKQLLHMVANETSFVSAWVITGFLVFELAVYFTGFDMTTLFSELGYLTILLAVLVGFIPGCGPQIIMTTLYLQGMVPLSAQLANAISNDGDALFPALALAPKASLYATMYSAMPAVLVGYLVFFMGH